MIFNTNKNLECNNKEKSLSYYLYTSDRKFSDLSNQLHNNFCKSNKNTANLSDNLYRNESNKTHKSFSPKKTSKNMNFRKISPNNFRKSSPNNFRKISPKRSYRKNNR